MISLSGMCAAQVPYHELAVLQAHRLSPRKSDLAFGNIEHKSAASQQDRSGPGGDWRHAVDIRNHQVVEADAHVNAACGQIAVGLQRVKNAAGDVDIDRPRR